MCQGGLRKPIQGGGRGVNVHSVRDFPGQGKAAYLVFEVADDDPLTLLSRSSTLHVQLAGPSMSCQGVKVRIWLFSEKRHTVTFR